MSRAKQKPVKALNELKNKAKILIAVSGGVDSCVLLHSCKELKSKKKWEIHVAHVDHSLREDSIIDYKFVKSLCEKYELQFYHKKHIGEIPKSDIENWGRKLRYSFFKELDEKNKYDYIFTAHHADDVAETYLMRLIANKEPRSILKYDVSRKIFRPFLEISKATIFEYAKEFNLQFREDSTNFDSKYLRNKIRNDLIPYLRDNFDPGISETLSNRAVRSAEDLMLISEYVSEKLKKLESLEFGSKEWLNKLKELLKSSSDVLKNHIITQMLKNKLGFNLGKVHASKASDFFLGNSARLELPSHFSLVRKSGTIKLLKI